jgi:predicted peptidase
MFLPLTLAWLLAASPVVPTPLQATTPAGQQEAQAFEKKITITVGGRYLLYLPKDYGKESGKKWPLVLFLHGAGERGDDLAKVKVHGPPKLAAAGKDFPFILVSPQCPEDAVWETQLLNALLDTVMEKYAVDADRVYCTGLSMGGFGTWALAAAFPERFAAIAPICGGGNPKHAERLKSLPIWAFHGAKDAIVPLRFSEEMVNALKAVGNTQVRLTVYPNAEHDSWTETYNNPAFYEWLLQQKRPTKK